MKSITLTLRRLAFASVALVGACFAVGQGCWFAFLVTYLVTELRLSLTSAGLVFAVMQAAGVLGRILLGWVSDRLGSGLQTLRAVAVTSAATSLALALTSPGWPAWAIALLASIGGVTSRAGTGSRSPRSPGSPRASSSARLRPARRS